MSNLHQMYIEHLNIVALAKRLKGNVVETEAGKHYIFNLKTATIIHIFENFKTVFDVVGMEYHTPTVIKEPVITGTPPDIEELQGLMDTTLSALFAERLTSLTSKLNRNSVSGASS